MHRSRNSFSLGQPKGHYSHAIEVASNARWLHVSGQIGTMPDGKMASGIKAQAEICWHKIQSILAEGGMEIGDIVSYQAILTRREDVAGYREVRDRVLGSAKPATMATVGQLFDPEGLVEISAIAAKQSEERN